MRRSSSTFTLSTIPFRSSNLAIPPTPFSPQWPVTPTGTTAVVAGKEQPEPTTAWRRPPPTKALKWLWQCHVCNRIYQLGVTRRCLDDGHYFCAGTMTVRRNKRTGTVVRKHRACASEFDYSGWKHWAVWRREPTVVQGPRRSRKDCWNACDYPSECRWGRQYGISTSPVVPSQDQKIEEEVLQLAAVTLGGELEKQASKSDPGYQENGHEEEHIPNALLTEAPTDEEVLETAKRRKRRSGVHSPSPLAFEEEQTTGTDQSQDAEDQSLTAEPPLLIKKGASYFQKAIVDLEKSIGRVQIWANVSTNPKKDNRAA